jgi:photosystem II stability/assembly factor-like uncharacterized protein
MKKLFCITALFVASVLHAQTPVWTQFPNSPVGGGNFRNDDICFVDLTNGWSARGTDGLYHTTNSGQSWFSVTPHIVTNVAHFRSIGFASPTRGWAGNLGPGAYDSKVTDTNLLYETYDGGNTWGVVTQINNSGMQGFCAMHIPDAQHIYGVGRVRGPAFFVKSEDGGNTWYVTNLTAGGVMGGLMDVYFMNTNLGFTVGMDTNSFYTPPYFANIARTTNGGLSWDVMASARVTNSYFWKMSWPTTNVGYVSLQQNSAYSSFVFYKTIDGGQTWVSNGIPLSTIGSPSSFELQGVGFVSTNEGWLGGGSLAAPYNMIHTTDGGLTWTPMGYVNANNLNRFRFASPTLGYLSGIKLHVFHIPLAATISPVATNVSAGANAVFSATTYGTPPMQFQWRLNGTNLVGGITNSLSLTNVSAANAGNYDLVLSDFSGSITSAVATLTVSGVVVAPTITNQPQSQVVNASSNVTFTVGASGTAPLSFQWQFNGSNLAGATNMSYTRTNVQPAVVGNYSVVVTNLGGSVTSSVAVLSLGFADDFDGYVSPSAVISPTTTNGYKIFFGADSGAIDFKAVFGFDYSTVTFPTNIPSAPHSIGGTTKGLFLTVNKDATGIAAGVNLYPLAVFAANNFALKFDMWLNWTNTGSATEHALFGINHSGNITNRVSQATSDGLFFAVDGDGNVAATTTTIRDFAVFHGAGTGAIPFLMTTNNTSFGPTPPLGKNFDNSDPGMVGLFPVKSVPGYTTAAGSPGMGWVSGEVRQENNIITCLLNGVAIVQYTNSYGYTNGAVLIGYNDVFPSLGSTNNFVIFDNISVTPIVFAPVKILSPQVVGNNFSFNFATELYESYTVQWTTNLISGGWTAYTNFFASSTNNTSMIPLPANAPAQFFRVSRP